MVEKQAEEKEESRFITKAMIKIPKEIEIMEWI